jgi:hypothetical protein
MVENVFMLHIFFTKPEALVNKNYQQEQEQTQEA